MPVETCVNCGKRVNDPLGVVWKDEKNRKCPHCGNDFDTVEMEGLIDGRGRVNFEKLMGKRR